MSPVAWLAEIVRNVVLVVVLASFLEMLLPQESLGRYVKMVMGLFVLISLLAPVLSVLNKSTEFDISGWIDDTKAPGQAQVMAEGQRLADQNRQRALAGYQEKLRQQVAATVSQITGSVPVQTVVEVVADPDAYGRIRVINVTLAPPGRPEPERPTGSIEIEPVTINRATGDGSQAAGTAGAISQKAREVRQALQTIYGLGADQVIVKTVP